MSYGENLRQLRAEKGVTIEALARQLGVEPMHLFMWEYGNEMPPEDKQRAIENILGAVMPEELTVCGGIKPEPYETEAPAVDVEAEEQRKKDEGFKALKLLFILGSIAAFLIITILMFKEEDTAVNVVNCNWVLFLFSLLPLGGIIFGAVANKRGRNGTANIIVGAIFFVICLYLASLGSAISGFDITALVDEDEYVEADYIAEAAEKVDFKLPKYEITYAEHNGAVGLINSEDDLNQADYNYDASKYIASECVFYCEAEIAGMEPADFCRRLGDSDKWMFGLPTELVGAVYDYYYLCDDYFLLYNEDTQEYNTLPQESGSYKFIVMTYDEEQNCLLAAEFTTDIVR